MKIHELTLHKDSRIFNLNELDYRSYFIPFESEEATLKAEKTPHITPRFAENGFSDMSIPPLISLPTSKTEKTPYTRLYSSGAPALASMIRIRSECRGSFVTLKE